MERDLKQLIAQMTLEEKAGLCSGQDFWRLKGIERLGIPSIMVTDGPHGLRKQKEGADHVGLFDSVPATCFPSAAGVACSWDRELIQSMGRALGEECQAEDVSVLLGPGVNIKRSPLCGRNFEYFSEDPYLSSQMASHHIQGVQSQGVGTSLKHFAANNQEHRRMTSDSIVDERTLREIYLASFEGAVTEAQPWTVMSSYNKVNGTFASENAVLLNDILREEWGFQGFVVSDWGAVNERVDGLAAGLELEMPSSNGEGDRKIVEAVTSGKLSEALLDQAVERVLRIVFKAADGSKANAAYDKSAHHQLARRIARESMVLLKNDEHMLPLRREGEIAVIGELAVKPRYQGGGSSHVNPTKLDDILEAFTESAGDNVQVVFAKGYELHVDDVDDDLTAEALRIAAKADRAVLFAGLPDRYESEGYDRSHLRLPANQIELIQAVAAVQPNLVIVLSNGAPIEMPWISNAKAVLEAYLGGQALGGAIADLLFGDANPCGKLAETFPKRLQDTPAHLYYGGEKDTVEYREGIFVGYRYYDAIKLEPLFPFGHGLSYTTFSYSNLVVPIKELRDDEPLTVYVDVTNTGDRRGKEIVQLYVRELNPSVIRPDKELKGFAKVELEPGETKTAAFTLDKRSFAFYDAGLKDWRVETGAFELLIGKSCAEIGLVEQVKVISTTDPVHVAVTRNSTIGDLLADGATRTAIMNFLQHNNPLGALGDAGGEASEMMEAVMRYLPLRALISFSGGRFSEADLESLVAELNAILGKGSVE
jgi:beta-glucosidase